MAENITFLKAKVAFADDKEYNGFGSTANYLEIPYDIDATLASSVFPLRVNSLPFTWEQRDADGVLWSLSIGAIDETTQKSVVEFYIGGLSSITDTVYIYNVSNRGFPFFVLPLIKYTITGTQISTVGVKLRVYRPNADIGSGTVGTSYRGTFIDGVTTASGSYPVGTSVDTLISLYENESATNKRVSVLDFKSSGAVRYKAKSTLEQNPDSNFGSTSWEVADIEGMAYRGIFSWSEYSSKPDLADCTMVINPPEFVYDGQEHVPSVSIYDGDTLLVEGEDYILSLSPDLINVGQKIALAIATAFGDYSGEIQGAWAIVPRYSDPYSPGGTTVPSTGPTDGSWGLPEDDLAVGGSPFNDLATQLYRPYAMTAAQVASFSNQLWNTDILDVISRYFEKPTEVVISLMSFPFTVECENSVQINFNWISTWSSVYVLGHPITQEIQTLDFGYVDLERYSGLFYDYQPYSSVQLYLPYIGFVPLKMNEVVGKRIRLTYLVDVLSGDFTAVVETSALGTPEPEKTLPYIGFYQGNIARPMPLSQQDLFSLFKKGTEIAITGAVAATAGTVGAIEGLAAEKAVGEAVQYTEQGSYRAADMAMGRAQTSGQMSQSAYKTFRRFGAATAANSILSIGNASAPILRNGTIDGISGRTSGQEAFIVITVPNQNVPENQRILGYPTNQPGPLSKFSGYTEVRDIRLKIPNATESEIAEIESIVRGGIVI